MLRSDQPAALHKRSRSMVSFVLNSSFAFNRLPVTPANFDFHCHSIVSDGFLPPAVVAQRAAGNGVDLWALTDHDDLGGLAEARAAAEAQAAAYEEGAKRIEEVAKATGMSTAREIGRAHV